jgi:REP element-mobilizing transposase RayT
MRSRLACLRSQFVYPTVRLVIASLRSGAPRDFRVVEFSVQRNHLHLLVEASDRASLSSGLRSLVIRLARQVNRLLMRRGPVWADRWHGHTLTSPRAVRRAIVYVLANFRKHADVPSLLVDPFSSAPYFAGFRDWSARPPPDTPAPMGGESGGDPRARRDPSPVSPSATWLLASGWKRNGLISVHERPHS